MASKISGRVPNSREYSMVGRESELIAAPRVYLAKLTSSIKCEPRST